MNELGVSELSAGEFALRLSALRGTSAYAAYLVDTDTELSSILTELAEEFRAMDAGATVANLAPADAAHLVTDLDLASAEIVVVDARTFASADWALLDRRRSSIAHRGLLIFVTKPANFDELMRVAPNLASWLGGEVFASPHDEALAQTLRERRLAALRAWAEKSDQEIVQAARDGSLPADPEYAEWLVLLGHGELIGPSAS